MPWPLLRLPMPWRRGGLRLAPPPPAITPPCPPDRRWRVRQKPVTPCANTSTTGARRGWGPRRPVVLVDRKKGQAGTPAAAATAKHRRATARRAGTAILPGRRRRRRRRCAFGAGRGSRLLLPALPLEGDRQRCRGGAARGGIKMIVPLRQGEGVEVRGAGQGDADRSDGVPSAVAGAGAAARPAGRGGGGRTAHAGVVAAAAVAAVPGLEGEAGGDATSDKAVADREGCLQRVLFGRCLHRYIRIGQV